MNNSRRLLILSGIGLTIIGMAYGLWYAVFAEHQILDQIGGSLASAFVASAHRDPVQSQHFLAQYREARYVYDRQVDVHGHWIGLAMLLLVIGIGFNQVNLPERGKFWLGLGLLAGSFLFPLGVLLETANHGPVPQAIAVIGSLLIIASLAAITVGVMRKPLPGQ